MGENKRVPYIKSKSFCMNTLDVVYGFGNKDNSDAFLRIRIKESLEVSVWEKDQPVDSMQLLQLMVPRFSRTAFNYEKYGTRCQLDERDKAVSKLLKNFMDGEIGTIDLSMLSFHGFTLANLYMEVNMTDIGILVLVNSLNHGEEGEVTGKTKQAKLLYSLTTN